MFEKYEEQKYNKEIRVTRAHFRNTSNKIILKKLKLTAIC